MAGQAIFHIALHFLVPLVLVAIVWRAQWRKAYLLMLLAFVIDLDHLLAVPVYDPQRCSVGFHPLHSAVPIFAYGVLAALPWSRLLGVGLLLHILLDSADCYRTQGIFYVQKFLPMLSEAMPRSL